MMRSFRRDLHLALHLEHEHDIRPSELEIQQLLSLPQRLTHLSHNNDRQHLRHIDWQDRHQPDWRIQYNEPTHLAELVAHVVQGVEVPVQIELRLVPVAVLDRDLEVDLVFDDAGLDDGAVNGCVLPVVVAGAEGGMHEGAAVEALAILAPLQQFLDHPAQMLDADGGVGLDVPLAVKGRVHGADDHFGVGDVRDWSLAQFEVPGEELVVGAPAAVWFEVFVPEVAGRVLEGS